MLIDCVHGDFSTRRRQTANDCAGREIARGRPAIRVSCQIGQAAQLPRVECLSATAARLERQFSPLKRPR